MEELLDNAAKIEERLLGNADAEEKPYEEINDKNRSTMPRKSPVKRSTRKWEPNRLNLTTLESMIPCVCNRLGLHGAFRRSWFEELQTVCCICELCRSRGLGNGIEAVIVVIAWTVEIDGNHI